MPPPPPPPPADTPILVAVVTHAPAPEAPAPTELPKTGSLLPLVGLLGMLFCGFSAGIRMLRSI